MNDPLISYEQVAEKLAIDPKVSLRYERLALIWSVSVEILLKVRDHRDELRRLLTLLIRDLQGSLVRDAETDPNV